MYSSLVKIRNGNYIPFYVKDETIFVPCMVIANDGIGVELRQCLNYQDLVKTLECTGLPDMVADAILKDIACNYPDARDYYERFDRLPEWFMNFKPKFDNIIKPKQ